jgi:hypothetical protein
MIVVELFFQIGQRVSPQCSKQKPLVRLLELIFLGKTETTGYLHHCMCNLWTLKALLNRVGFFDVKRAIANISQIPGWQTFTLIVFIYSIRPILLAN